MLVDQNSTVESNVATVITDVAEPKIVSTKATVQDMMAAAGWSQANKEIVLNTNEIPFITFISPSNQATNVYFSKATSPGIIAAVKAGGQLNKQGKPFMPLVKGFLSDYTFQLLQYPRTPEQVAAGEAPRLSWKIGAKGGNRFEADDL